MSTHDRASASGKSPTGKCPQCRKPTSISQENLNRPFCSANCKNADLAAWASDHYQIPGAPLSEEREKDEYE